MSHEFYSQSIKDRRFKDESPQNTVQKILNILEETGIEVVEDWEVQSTIGTHSLRLNVKGSQIGSNGKGMTEAYARASAYAELMERIQNNMKMIGHATFCNLFRDKAYEFLLFPDEKTLTAEALLEKPNAFMQMFLKNESVFISQDLKHAVEELQSVQKMDYNHLHEKNKFLCVPYLDIKAQELTYVPYFIANLHYGSNGMCAGNTLQEALVQGLSEIVERHIMRRIFTEQACLPSVPESYLSKFPEIHNMYKTVQALEGYDVIIKDCSYGGTYGAAAIVIIEKNTGKIGVKVGSHPNYNIALERLFTEATQGISLEKFAKRSMVEFGNTGVTHTHNLMNGFKTGDAKYPYQLLSAHNDFEFVEPRDVSHMTNDELLKQMLALFYDDGYQVLVHDVSYLGFPSYQILVPGISELNYPQIDFFEAENTRFHVQPLLENPERITPENCRFVASVVNFYKYALMDNTLSNLIGRFSKIQYPGNEVGLDHHYFLSMCYVMLGNYEAAKREMILINTSIMQRGLPENIKYQCIEKYLSGMAALKDHQRVMSYIEQLYEPHYSETVDYLFIDTSKVIVKQYPSQYGENCQSSNKAHRLEFEIFSDVFDRLKARQASHTIDQLHILAGIA